jgi:3-hydroxyacyl-[acyl-carrier-protein] dehydratase
MCMDDVLQRLPHREPFRFLTRVVSLAPGERGEAVWSLSGGEDFFRGHFPGEPIVPGVLISEALAQLSGLVGLHAGPGGSGRLVHVDMRYDGTVRPPADVVLRSALTRSMGPLRQFEVSAHVGDERIARGTLALAGVMA